MSTESATAKIAEAETELKVMKRFQKELADLPAPVLRRLGPWVASVASELAAKKEAAADAA